MESLSKHFKLLFCIVSVVFLMIASAQSAHADAVANRKTALEKELTSLEAQVDAQKKILEAKQRESVSLERDIAILNAKIEKAKLAVKARDIAISQLSSGIVEKSKVIGVLSSKIEHEKESLAQIIRKIREFDSYSIAEVTLNSQRLSSFFEDLDSFASVNSALRESFTVLEDNKSRTEDEKASLEDKRSEEVSLRKIQELEKRRVEEQEVEKKKILKESRGVEEVYQKVLKAQQESAAKIRAELFTLRGTAAIPFGQALDLATKAGNKTGVRPAFILAIIAEESNLGENVGTGNWLVDMNNPRDTVPFKDITSRLGLDPNKMPVSKKPWYGYGGAMGPAQFIPSTWILYEDRIAEATGHNLPNPWDPGDAFMASAIYLKDSGAAKQTATAERYAALCYLAGCKNAGKKAYQFYADDVIDLADKYQNQINIINRGN